MGLDYGNATVGIALSDEMFLTAQPLETIFRKKSNQLRHTYQRIEELIKEYDVTELVVGLPKNMNDTIGPQAMLCIDFANDLERRTGIKPVMWDERLTSFEAENILNEAGLDYRKKAKVVDKVAAAIILKGYLEERAAKKIN